MVDAIIDRSGDGYWHQEQMERVVAAGSRVLIPPV
jgi:hypothetical protein